MNVRTPFNPKRLAETWPTVEKSIDQQRETEAINTYLASLDKLEAKKRDFIKPGRRWK